MYTLGMLEVEFTLGPCQIRVVVIGPITGCGMKYLTNVLLVRPNSRLPIGNITVETVDSYFVQSE